MGQPRHGFDGVSFYDDWSTQSGLIVSPTLWREFWKPRYRRQFDLAHGEGLDVYFHCCGAVAELIPDLIGYIEEYGSIGLSEENYQACIDAFHDIGAGR
ncbi:MAG: hypothetical protein NT005_03230 [Spirochaetes bacterium]|nr:hypothetical protein [Spirochaetota bacterium]